MGAYRGGRVKATRGASYIYTYRFIGIKSYSDIDLDKKGTQTNSKLTWSDLMTDYRLKCLWCCYKIQGECGPISITHRFFNLCLLLFWSASEYIQSKRWKSRSGKVSCLSQQSFGLWISAHLLLIENWTIGNLPLYVGVS